MEDKLIPFSIEFHFDEKSNTIIENMWKKLSERGISDYMDKFGVYPHISLAILDDINTLEIEKIVEESVKNERVFSIKISKVGTFPTDEGVIFLAVDTSDTLINFHKKIHQGIKNIEGKSKYYLPGFWLPHCTLGMNISSSKVQEAFDIIKEDFEPFDARIETIHLIEYDPVKIIKSFHLKR